MPNRHACAPVMLDVFQLMRRSSDRAQQAGQGLELLPGGAVANENEALALDALAKSSCIPWCQVTAVRLEGLHSHHHPLMSTRT